MPNDVIYGAECEARIGLMADAVTDPTAWFPFQFISFTPSPSRERNPRPKLGAPRENVLDPIKPIPSFFRQAGDLVVDFDTFQTPRLLRCILGAPVTTGPASGVYTHTWKSGSKTQQLAALQISTGTSGDKIRVFRGLTFGQAALRVTGEDVQNHDLQISARAISRARLTDWLSGTLNASPGEAPVNRTLFRADGVAVSNTLEASWSYSSELTEDIFLSELPQISGIRPGGGAHSGSARFRAVGEAFDDLEEGDVVTGFDLQGLSTVAGHSITLAHPNALLSGAPLPINGPGLIERTFAWSGHQTPTVPAARITVVNNVASYAT